MIGGQHWSGWNMGDPTGRVKPVGSGIQVDYNSELLINACTRDIKLQSKVEFKLRWGRSMVLKRHDNLEVVTLDSRRRGRAQTTEVETTGHVVWSRLESLEYIATLVGQLRTIAAQQRLPHLESLLTLVQQEARRNLATSGTSVPMPEA